MTDFKEGVQMMQQSIINPQSLVSFSPPAPRTCYETPLLVEYGSLVDLTQSNFLGMGSQDGAGGVVKFLFFTRP